MFSGSSLILSSLSYDPRAVLLFTPYLSFLFCPETHGVRSHFSLAKARTISLVSPLFLSQSKLPSAFSNEDREFVIVGGGNAAGYAARTFVEHGMADGRLCIVSKESHAAYERPALTKAYLVPLDKKPALLPGFIHVLDLVGKGKLLTGIKRKGLRCCMKIQLQASILKSKH